MNGLRDVETVVAVARALLEEMTNQTPVIVLLRWAQSQVGTALRDERSEVDERTLMQGMRRLQAAAEALDKGELDRARAWLDALEFPPVPDGPDGGLAEDQRQAAA